MKLANYQILNQLYSGSQTVIYRAIRDTDQQPVVLKTLKDGCVGPIELAQLRNQYTIGKALNLPGVIQTYSLEPHKNGYILVMEDFGGISLKEEMQQGGASLGTTTDGLREFLNMALQIASALDGLYQQRVIHKDIKPANILIHPTTRQVKLIDFSIASLLPKETQAPANPNVLEGTLAYLSPEQTGRMNRGIDYRTDFYSLGITFFELLTGQLPFQASDPMEWVHCHLAKQPATLDELTIKNEALKIPPAIFAIVLKLMAKNAEDRYQSALGLKHDLETCWHQLKETGQISSFSLGEQDVCDRLIISEKLYGRQAEVNALLAAYDRAAQGSTEMLLVAGFSGIGKTAIVNEVHKPIAGSIGSAGNQGSYFVKGKFDQFQRNMPFSAIVQAFQDLVGQLLQESRSQIEAWKEAILNAVGENGQVIIDLIPEVELLIGPQPEIADLEPGASQNRLHWVFQQFIRVFPSASHPLVMFLDDLQWADSASLNLLQALMGETTLHHLLLIGAYRDNEVHPVHPLMLTCNEIRKTGAIVNTLTLLPLPLQDLNQWVADTLHCSTEEANPLSQIMFAKTKGNPFFSTQFLKSLHESELVTFDFKSSRWRWDIDQIQALSLTDDVVEFMIIQLQKLPQPTQDALKLAACIGSTFDLETLVMISETSRPDIRAALWEAMQAGLVLSSQPQTPSSELLPAAPLPCSTATVYTFLHDRVQQAAYLLIPEAQKAATHLKIGQLLLRNTPLEERENKLFEIVNSLNHGLALIHQTAERNELVQLNLMAARKAMVTSAYSMAFEYATTGIALLPEGSWQSQYALTLMLYELGTEAAFLCGLLEPMEQLAEVVSHQAKKPLDRVKIDMIRIQACSSQNQLLEAIAIACASLKQFGVTFPTQPNQQDLQQAFQETAALLAESSPEELLNLPVMSAAEPLAVMEIATSMIPAVYNAVPNLFPLIILLLVKLSVQYGNAPLSAFGYANYGTLLNIVLQDIGTADQFGQLALTLANRCNSKTINARTYYVLGAFIVHWKAHIRESLPLLLQSYQAGLETGNLEFVGYAAKDICQYSYLIGKELPKLETEIQAYNNVLANLKQSANLTTCQTFWQVVLNLLGESEDPCILTGEATNENNLLNLLLNANNITGLHYFYLHKLILCYLFGNYTQAIALAAQAERYLAGGNGFITIPIFHFYDSLAALAVSGDRSIEPETCESETLLQRVIANQDKVKYWADHAPMNYLHKYYLVEAERQRVLGETTAAMDLYDLAITLAREAEYLNDAALACELTARFYLHLGKTTIAQAYLLNAYQSYERWGAQAKLRDLEQRYPELLAPMLPQTLHSTPSTSPPAITITSFNPTTETTNTSSSSMSEILDLATVLKASQALSGEIQLEKLLSTLMQVVIENAGAQTGVFMLNQEDNLVIQAQALQRLGGSEGALQITALQAIPVQSSSAIPASLINYVSRTLQPLVIDDAMATTKFASDPYIAQHQPKSILCTPICKQGKLIGLLYLENNLIRGAFTHDRLKVLKLLTTQAAISLENALLYESLTAMNEQLEEYNSTLEQRVIERTQDLNQKTQHLEQALQELQQTQTQLIQAEKMSSLGQLVAGIAHEINNPVNFIHGNLLHINGYMHNLLDLIVAYQQAYPQPAASVETIMRDIDLEFLLEDLPKLLSSMKVGSDRIRSIVLSLRNFSRLDEAEKKFVNIHEGIDSALMILQHRLKGRLGNPTLEIIKDYDDLPQVECYAGQLNQVFMNILNNAIDALEGSQPPDRPSKLKTQNLSTIRIRTEQFDSDWVRIRIADNGPGIPESVQQKIFDPFFTTKPVGQGIGLGLSICYQIVVEKHQGRLLCHSTPDQGTEFIVEIPLRNHRLTDKR
jgi:predicted ATPase